MMLCTVMLCLIFGLVKGRTQHARHEEGTCYSRFDYEYKVVQKLVILEERQKELDRTIKLRFAAADDRFETLLDTIQEQKEQISSLETVSEAADKTITTLEDKLARGGSGGSTYVRWGRTSCPDNGTELVYHGYAGGSYWKHKGAAAGALCLPRDPLWGKYDDTVVDYAMVYGAEYQHFGNLFPGLKTNDDVPCAVCRSPRPSVLMIPARNGCYGDWVLEYHGYLMSGYYRDPAASDYICVDDQAEVVPGGESDHDGKVFYSVEGKCGSLKCPPYVNGRELTCVVCSK